MRQFKHSPALSVAAGGIIAAGYVLLTFLSASVGLASGAIQLRLSEALCFLPALTPAAIPGLSIGCLLANMLTGCDPIDTLCGTAATFIGAIGAWLIGRAIKKATASPIRGFFFTVPNTVANVLVIPFVLRYVYGVDSAMWYLFVTVLIGELLAGNVLGTLFFSLSQKVTKRLNK